MMDKPISSLMEKDVVTVHTDDSLEKIEGVLDLHNRTYVPVVDANGVIFGIITAHDLVHFHSQKKNAKATHAWEVCTHRPIEVNSHTLVLEVAKLMVNKKIHHVLVSEDGHLKGVVSSFDLVEKYLLDAKNMFGTQQVPHANSWHSVSTPHSYAY